MVPAGELADADVVVLNTCCIRENADNKLYGNLGHLKSWKAQRDGRQIVVSGCLAQKDRGLVRERAAHVDVVMGTHNVHRAAELLRASTARRDHGDLRRGRHRRPRDVPVGAAGGPRDVVQRVGHDPDRLRQQLRLLHRARRTWRRDLPPVRRDHRRGRGARRRRCHRDHAARPERQQLRARPPAGGPPRRRHAASASARSSPICCVPRARSRASAGSGSRRRTPRTCAPRRSRRWPRPRPCARSCTTRCSRAPTASLPPCTAATRPSATSPDSPTPGGSSPTSPCRPTSSSASRARPTTTSSRRSRSPPQPDSTTPSRSSSRPRPGTEAATMTDRFVAPDVAAERFARLRVVIERSSLAGNQRRVGLHRGGPRRGSEQEGPIGPRRPHRPAPPGPLHAAAPGPGRVVRRGGGHRRRAAPPHRPARRGRRRTGAQVADPRRRPVTAAPVVVLGPTASGKSDVAMAAASAVEGTEIVAVDAMQVYRGMDIGTAKPSPADRARVPHHCLDLVEPSEPFTVTDYRAAYDRAVAGIAGRPLLVAGTGLYLAAVIDRLDVPGRWPDVRARLRREAVERPVGEADRPRPAGGVAHRPRQPPPGGAGVGGLGRQRTTVQLVRARCRRLPADEGGADRPALAAPRPRRAHRAAGRRR